MIVTMTVMIFTIMIVLLLLGFPMKVPLTAATLTVLLIFYPGEASPAIMIQQWIGGITPAALLAVPMFILAADIMTRGQAADRLLDMVSSFVGHVRGGLPMTTAVSCTLFGAMSGSTQATVVAIGSPLRPRLLKAGYSSPFATALIVMPTLMHETSAESAASIGSSRSVAPTQPPALPSTTIRPPFI